MGLIIKCYQNMCFDAPQALQAELTGHVCMGFFSCFFSLVCDIAAVEITIFVSCLLALLFLQMSSAYIRFGHVWFCNKHLTAY